MHGWNARHLYYLKRCFLRRHGCLIFTLSDHVIHKNSRMPHPRYGDAQHWYRPLRRRIAAGEADADMFIHDGISGKRQCDQNQARQIARRWRRCVSAYSRDARSHLYRIIFIFALARWLKFGIDGSFREMANYGSDHIVLKYTCAAAASNHIAAATGHA